MLSTDCRILPSPFKKKLSFLVPVLFAWSQSRSIMLLFSPDPDTPFLLGRHGEDKAKSVRKGGGGDPQRC